VARDRAAADGLADATFRGGTAASMPLGDGGADVVLSVFGVIFAPDAAGAAAEMARVLAPDGRIVLSAWLPDGPLAEVNRAAREAVVAALGAPAGPPPFAWHDAAALAGLLGPHGFAVRCHEEAVTFDDESPEAYLTAELDEHPLSVAGRAILEPRGEVEALRERMLGILTAANEEPGRFRVRSRYVIATATRGAS
jgi:SAM-dependent methyltransferase